MSHPYRAFWHQESFNRFMADRLPQLLAARLPLVDYQFEATGPYTCQVKATFASAGGEIEISFDDLPRPDDEGFFQVNGNRSLVGPVATSEDLATAEIHGVGDHLYHYIEARLGEAPPDMAWSETLIRAWLPLDAWLHDCIEQHRGDPYRWLNQANWLDRTGNLRHILIPERQKPFNPGHYGRVCPFETPEGPNVGRVLRISAGAEIRDQKIVIVDEGPEAGLGVNTRMIPFLEHNDPLMLLMGVNMMRQWLIPPDPEPALVQTGYEPNAPDFWGGRNLLTAFIAWGGDTYERGIVISQSAAQKLSFPHHVDQGMRPAEEKTFRPLEPGDKLSNRHGIKGVISRILPDKAMPRLPDGTPVEIIYHFLPVRKHTGQLREAVMSRIARAEGKPAIVPPFHAPDEAELRQRLVKAGLPEDGLESLTDPGTSKPLARRSTVGWVYWGRLIHTAHSKLQAATHGPGAQRHGELEYYLLRNLKAFEVLREHFNTRSTERDDSDTLAGQVIAGTLVQAGPPTPRFAALQKRLAAAGIEAALNDETLTFKFAPPKGVSPPGETFKLARPIPHPWLPGGQQGPTDELEAETMAHLLAHKPDDFTGPVPALEQGLLTEIGVFDTLPEYASLVEANGRLTRLLNSQAPESLVRQAYRQLISQVGAFFEALLRPDELRFWNRVGFSGRAVLAPGPELPFDQVGLPEEIAWTLYGPQVVRELGDEKAVQARNEGATKALDEIMAQSWIIVHRTPCFTPTTMLAFHPVRDPDRVIRLHPLACDLLNADFDGDQAAVYLPLTEGGQREAAEKLSIAGHLRREPDLIESLCGLNEAVWGLADLSRTAEGRAEIAQIAGREIATAAGVITRTTLTEAMRDLLTHQGAEKTLDVLDRLMCLGFEAVKISGASMSPFLGSSLNRSVRPDRDAAHLWEAYAEELSEQLATRTDFAEADLGPQLLAARSGAQGQASPVQLMRALGRLAGVPVQVRDINGQCVFIRHGYSEGLTAEELYTEVVEHLEGQMRFVSDMERATRQLRQSNQSQSFHVLGRAGRAEHPGHIFARAAATGEIDPLTDLDARLFVGLPVKQ
jgi:hypothetical protein